MGKETRRRKNMKKTQKKLKKGIDKREKIWYNSEAVREGSEKEPWKLNNGETEAEYEAKAKYETKGTRTIPLRSKKLYESNKSK